MKKHLLIALALVAVTFTSCSEEDYSVTDNMNKETVTPPTTTSNTPTTTTTTNTPAKKTVINPVLTIPATYDFKDKEGKSTVSFPDQETHLTMAVQLKSKLSDPFDAILPNLTKMFKEGKGFVNSQEVADVDGSGKKLRATVAAATHSVYGAFNKENLVKKMDNWLVDFTKISTITRGYEGKAGMVRNTSNTKKAYVTAKGIEVNEAVAKTIIGAVCLDQVVNKYISKAGLDKNMKTVAIEVGKNYTNIEHNWDEAYGYVFGKNNGSSVLLGNYLEELENLAKFRGILGRVKTNFIKGRAAASNMEYKEMHEFAAAIRKDLSMVVAVKFVHHLGAVNKTELRDKFHGLSEGYGFAHALNFAHANGIQLEASVMTPIISAMDDLWKLTPTKATELQNKVSALFGFTVADAE